jgi:hypothetical protein
VSTAAVSDYLPIATNYREQSVIIKQKKMEKRFLAAMEDLLND